MINRFDKLFNLINREGKCDLRKYLEENGYFQASASTQYHGAKDQGLLIHSITVTELMLDLGEMLNCFSKDMTESMVIVGLFHDLGKAGYFGKQNYVENILKSGKRSESKPYEINKELLNVPHEISSIHILSKYIKLTEEETFAILMHNGMYGPLKYELSGRERPLQMILHFADMWSSRVLEEKTIDIKDTLF